MRRSSQTRREGRGRNSRILIMISMMSIFAISNTLAGEQYLHTINTDPSSVHFDGSGIRVDGGEMIDVPGAPKIGYRLVKLVLPQNTSVAGLSVTVPDTISLQSGTIDFAPGDIKTGISQSETATSPDQAIYGSDEIYPGTRVEILNSGYWGDIHLIDLAVYPVGYRPLSGQSMIFPEIIVSIDLEARIDNNGLIPSSDRFAQGALSNTVDNESDLSIYSPAPADDQPHGDIPAPEYLVVTSGEIAPGFRAFVEWKNQKGVPTDVALIEDILTTSPGIDPPEQLRNYLIEAYNAGVRYVLLGGDEDNVPIRYLYPSNTNFGQPELYRQFVSDLYYADLTGEWDADGDGVWGESFNDHPDIYPELYVGRIPARNASHAAIWSAKAVTYEKNPGNGNNGYLTKALFISADQMRDMNQHDTLAAMLPENFTYDATRLIEEPSGRDPNPTSPLAETVVEVMQEGWGFISNLNHGDFSWYASLSTGYGSGGWSGVWGDTVLWDGCGALSHLTTYNQPAVQYSTSCLLSALDFDKDIFFPGPYISTYCYGESAVLERGAGVAFLGNSRNGWVNGSYQMEKKFLGHVFVDSTSRLSVAEALSKIDSPNHRDLAYGHNLNGDPEMSLWLSVDGKLRIEGTDRIVLNRSQYAQYRVSMGDTPVHGARVCMYMEGEIFSVATTNPDGIAMFCVNPKRPGSIVVTVTKPRHIPAQISIAIESATDIEDEPALPTDPEVFQNYPNPFNSNTTIEFNLSERARVDLEVYDIGGRLVKRLASGEFSPGSNVVTWNGDNESNNTVASGVYFFRFVSGSVVTVKQMTLLK